MKFELLVLQFDFPFAPYFVPCQSCFPEIQRSVSQAQGAQIWHKSAQKGLKIVLNVSKANFPTAHCSENA